MTSIWIVALILGAAGDPPVTLGREKQLFLDDFLLVSQTGVKRRVNPAVKHPANPVIRKTEAWEDPFNVLYGSVILDGGRYRMWYLIGRRVSYAESDDSIAWTKPRLGLIAVGGHDTNVLFQKLGDTARANPPTAPLRSLRASRPQRRGGRTGGSIPWTERV